VTSRDCNKFIAENQVAFSYELLMRGNDKLGMFSSLCTERTIVVADFIQVFLMLVRNNIFHLYYQSLLQPQ
jgi:hypothetical protein